MRVYPACTLPPSFSKYLPIVSCYTLPTGIVRVKEQLRTDGVVSVTETRNFAGKEMAVTKTYVEGSKVGRYKGKVQVFEWAKRVWCYELI